MPPEEEKVEGTETQETQPAEKPTFDNLAAALAANPTWQADHDKLIQSESDKRVTQAQTTWTQKREQDEKDAAAKKAKDDERALLKPAALEKAKENDRIAALEARLAATENIEADKAFKATLKASGIPEGMSKYLSPESNIDELKADYQQWIKDSSKGGDVNPQNIENGLPVLTTEQKRAAKLAGMTEIDYAKAVAARDKKGGSTVAYATPK